MKSCFNVKSVFIGSVLLLSSAYAGAETIKSTSICSPSPTLSGFYVLMNGGYSHFYTNLYRRPDIFQLNNGKPNINTYSLVPAIGYDFDPQYHLPVRLEANIGFSNFYNTMRPLYKADALYTSQQVAGYTAHDQITLYNPMLTVALDWHNRTRFTPYIGASAGAAYLFTSHEVSAIGYLDSPKYNNHQTNFSWGGIVGSHMQLSQHFFANVQFAYTDLGKIVFKNGNSNDLKPKDIEYQSNYLREANVLVGLGYQF
jgi:opacity protein-like surface antigen